MALQRDKIVNNAEKLVAKGKIDSAIKEYQRLLDENPNDVNTLNRIGDLWVRIERIDEAAKVFRTIADHYSRDGFFLKAIAIYKKINKLDPSRLDTYARLADLYAKQGLAMEAKGQYMVLADFYLKHGDSENALQIYRKIGELDPQSVTVHVKLADLCAATGNNSEALEQYDQVGRLLLKRGMATEAVQVFSRALRLDAGNVDLAESLVSALIEERDYDHAVQIVNTALENNRANPRLIILLAKIYLAREQMDDARKVLEKGFTDNPGDVQIREQLASLYLRQGKPDRALELTAPIINVALDRAEGGAALDLLDQILKVEPNHTGALEKLVEAYTRLNEKPNVLEATNRLAEAFIAGSDFPAAERVLRELIRLDPENLQNREKLLFVRKQIGGTFEDIDDEIQPAEDLLIDGSDSPAPDSLPYDDEAVQHIHELTYDMELTPEPEVQPVEATRVGSAATPVAPQAEMSRHDLEFVTDHLTEAEVFAKYGLTDKAVEHLREVLERVPSHLPAWEKLLAVYLNEGIAAHVSSTAEQYILLLRERGEWQMAENLEHDIINRGYPLSLKSAAQPAAHPSPANMPPAQPERIHPRASAARPIEPIPAIEHGQDFDLEIEEEIDLEEHLATIDAAESRPAPQPTGSTPGIELDFSGSSQTGQEESIPYGGEFSIDEMLIASPASAPGVSGESPQPGVEAEETPSPAAEIRPAPIESHQAEYEFDLDTIVIDDLPTLDDLPVIDDLPELQEVVETAGSEAVSAVTEEIAGAHLPEDFAGGDFGDSIATENRSFSESEDDRGAEDESEDEPVLTEEPVAESAGAFLDEVPEQTISIESATPIAEPDEASLREQSSEEQDQVDERGPEIPPLVADDHEAESGTVVNAFAADAEPAHETVAGEAEENPQAEALGTFGEMAEEESIASDDRAEISSEPILEEMTSEEAHLAKDGDGALFHRDEAVRYVHADDSQNSVPSAEDLGELDFYIEQELIEEARNKLQILNTQFPQHPELVLRGQQFDAILPSPSLTSVGGTSTTDPDPEELFVPGTAEEIGADGSDQPTAPFSDVAADSADIFAAEDNFFDLAQELENDLDENLQEMPALSEDDQSLDQIFREFKKGVEQQLDTEDYETHYNLGIAYKEMGLIDEAIGEFQLASKDPARAIDGCSMLGLCFLEKGMPQLAIKWYRKAIEMPEISEDEHLGVLYDLALAYLETGDIENAHKNFLEVYGINSKYRDVGSRIKELEDAKRAQ